MDATVKLRKVGNSVVVTLPKDIADQLTRAAVEYVHVVFEPEFGRVILELPQ